MVHDPNSTSPPWASGRVLAASPGLQDPNFFQSLVYMVDHNTEGALGFVINRPAELQLNHLVEQEPLPESMKEIPILQGGPVHPENLLLACFSGSTTGFSCRMLKSVDEGAELALLEDSWVCGFLGYCGWEEGQLEGELREEAWTVTPPHQAMFEPRFARGIWSAVQSGDPRWPTLIPYLPEDPGLN